MKKNQCAELQNKFYNSKIQNALAFGRRIRRKRQQLPKQEWLNFVNFYFLGNFTKIEEFIKLAENENEIIRIHLQRPELNIRQLLEALHDPQI